MTGLVCNGDAIRALAVGSTVHARELLEIALTEGVGLAVPAAAYAVAWMWSTPPARMLLDDFLELSVVTVDPLDAASCTCRRRCTSSSGSAKAMPPVTSSM